MKKILFVISSMQNYGGTERVASLLANYLSDSNDVTIISRDINNSKTVYPLGDKVRDLKINGGYLNFLLKLRNYINSGDYDVIVIHTMSKLTPLILALNYKAKKIWSFEHTSIFFHSKIFFFLRKLLYQKLDKIIVLTRKDKDIYEKIASNVEIIYNPSPFNIRDEYCIDSKKILSIGSLEEYKGYDILLKVWKRVEEKHPDWSLDIYGSGSLYNSLQSYINSNSLRHVTLKGVTSEILQAYDSSSFFVMSSKFEGLPMVLIEAQTRALPIVAFDCPNGPAEIISDNKNGFLVEQNDLEGMYNSIVTLIENTELRKSFSDRARLDASTFAPKVIMRKWDKLIKNNT